MTESAPLIDLDITNVAHEGVFVGRHEGRVVFVPDAIPGERVRVRLTDTGRAAFWRAEAIEVLDASPHRRPHVWAPADIARDPERRPGGADFGHIALEHQRELKAHVLRDALTRMAGLDRDVVVEAAVGDTDGGAWRTRLGLHVDDEGRIGPYAARSHSVIEVDEHPLATPAVEDAALGLRRAKKGRVDLIEPAEGGVRILHRPSERARPARGAQRPGPDPRRETVVERVGDRVFHLDAGGFWQVHRAAARTLDDAVRWGIAQAAPGGADPDGIHLDLYGGVGLLGAALADEVGAGARVVTVEADRRASAHAHDNLVEFDGARAVAERVDRFLSRVRDDAHPAVDRAGVARGIVVLDPPRSGAGRETVEAIADLRPPGVVYVACDPVALARDVRTLRDRGYELEALRAFDLFPHSHHLEAVAVLRPRE